MSQNQSSNFPSSKRNQIDVYGFGSALLDVLIDVSDEDLAAFGFDKASYGLLDSAGHRQLLKQLEGKRQSLVCGGSLANSLSALVQLGGSAAFSGTLGDDRYGLYYKEQSSQEGLLIPNPFVVSGSTGICASLVTPDGERTMRVYLGVAPELYPAGVDEALLSKAEWLFIEGYLFLNPGSGQKTIFHVLDLAKKYKRKVALTSSDAFVIENNREVVLQALKGVDLLFANEAEAKALTGESEPQRAFGALCELTPNVVMSSGPGPVRCRYQGETAEVQTYPCDPRDLTGAGDMLAGSFMYGITSGIGLRQTLQASCYLAREVITRVGARLPSGTRQYWDECLAGVASQSSVVNR